MGRLRGLSDELVHDLLLCVILVLSTVPAAVICAAGRQTPRTRNYNTDRHGILVSFQVDFGARRGSMVAGVPARVRDLTAGDRRKRRPVLGDVTQRTRSRSRRFLSAFSILFLCGGSGEFEEADGDAMGKSRRIRTK